MAGVSTYLDFNGKTEEAFTFYKSVFNTDFEGEIMRWSNVPPQEGMPPLTEEQKEQVMHVTLPILGGHLLMGSDTFDLMGPKLQVGNNVHIMLNPDTREETSQLFALLSQDGQVTMELADMFWGDYYGSCVDKFGVCWMLNCTEKKS